MNRNSSDLREWAHFDLATFRCHFALDLVPNLSNRSLPENLSEVPREILIHEAGHVLQVAATATGIRLWAITQNIISLSLMAAERVAANTRGVLPLSVAYFPDEILHGSPFPLSTALRTASLFRFEFFGGSVRERTLESLEQDDSLVPYVVSGYASEERRWPRGQGVRDRCLYAFYQSDDRNTVRQVSLGAIHLLEGQAAILENLHFQYLMYHDKVSSHDATSGLAEALHRRPFEPYNICWDLYTRMIYDSKSSGKRPDPWEFLLMTDLALMMDDGAWKNQSFNPDYSLPFDNYLSILEIMKSDDSLRFGGYGDDADFQNRLLSALDFNSTMLQLTSRLSSQIDIAMDFTSDSPLADFNDVAKRAFDTCIQLRLDANGTSPATFLTVVPTPEIATFLSQVTLIDIGEVQLARASLMDNRLEIEEWSNNSSTRHIERIASEILYGPIGCSAIDHCRLPRRAACKGLTLSLSSYMNQCPREDMISRISTRYDIDFISGSLEAIDFIDANGIVRRLLWQPPSEF